MTVFGRRDRIAIAVIAVAVLAGWGVRLFRSGGDPDRFTVIRDAVEVPTSGTQPAGESPLTPKIDINTADAALLETLPMIGPVKARAIIDYRSGHGRFESVDALASVKGIGPATVETIRDHAAVYLPVDDAGDTGADTKVHPD